MRPATRRYYGSPAAGSAARFRNRHQQVIDYVFDASKDNLREKEKVKIHNYDFRDESPSPGEPITEVEIAQWLVAEGDYIEKDQAIAEVDLDKATLELPAETSGTISLKAEEGDAVVVGSVVCLIDTDGKPWKDN